MARRRAVDTRVPDFDSGIHLHTACLFQQAIAGGNIALPFTSYDSCPPLVHLLGALTIFITDMHPMALIMSSNIGFVPLMAFGCYGVGKTFASERAGLLAGLFAKADRGCSTLAAWSGDSSAIARSAPRLACPAKGLHSCCSRP